MKKFLAVDLETTGADPQRDQILEIGAIAYDIDDDLSTCRTFSTIVRHKRYAGDAFALQMNAALLREISDGCGARFDLAIEDFAYFVHERCKGAHPVGFNVGSFDVAFLKRATDVHMLDLPLHHRCVELSSLLAGRDTGEPMSSSVAVRTYLGESVAHRALEDALTAARLHQKWYIGDL